MSENNIAIVGMSCRFPGADTPASFWENLARGVNSVREITPERWSNERYHATEIDSSDTTLSKWCGLVDGIDQFDNRFFGISPREAKNMDPQQRLLLQETWHCLEDAAIPLKQLQDQKTMVCVGVMGNDYLIENARAQTDTDSFAALGNYDCILANRLSWYFDFQGESYSVNAACAASLVALHQAKKSLKTGECDFAIAAGVNLNIHPWKYISFSKSRMLSPDGQCKSFDQHANGYVPGDGIGVLLLQRLEDAERDGNHIYGLLSGSAVGHVGHSVSITAPDAGAQAEVINTAYRDAGISPEQTRYVEAHGTGTSLGDPIEIEGLKRAFPDVLPEMPRCKIGSVKSNIGHLEASAGIAGVIKVLMMFKHQQIPPSLNVTDANPVIDWVGSPFEVVTELSEWESETPRQASVSAFGFGGASGHVVLREYVKQQAVREVNSAAVPFMLSAKSAGAMQLLLKEWHSFSKSTSFAGLQLSDVSATLAAGRSDFSYRYGVQVSNISELKQALAEPAVIHDKTSSASRLLMIDSALWQNMPEFVKFTEDCPCFKSLFSETINLLSKRQQVAIQKDSWSNRYKALYQFITAYVAVQGLMEAGWKPDMITASGGAENRCLALVLAGVLSLKDAIHFMQHKHLPEHTTLHWPDIDFFDQTQCEVVPKVHFPERYFRTLLTESALNARSVQALWQRAQDLKASQPTFNRNLAEWDTAINQGGYGSLAELMSEEADLRQQYCGALLIQDAFDRLDRKWQLQRAQCGNDPVFNEWLGLMGQEVLPKNQLLALLLDEQFDFDLLAGSLNKQTGDFSSLPLLQRHLSESGAITELVKNQLGSESVPDRADQTLPENYEPLLLSEAVKKAGNLSQLLLQDWLKGADIKWEHRFPSGSYQKVVGLPGYPFEGKSFWLSRDFNAQTQQADALLYQQPVWRLVDNAHITQARPEGECHQVLVFATAGGWVSELVEAERAVLCPLPDSREAALDSLQAAVLSVADSQLVIRIYYIPDSVAGTGQNIAPVLPLFYLCQAISRLSLPHVELVLVTHDLHRVSDDGISVWPSTAALPGIARTFAQENPAVTVRCIDVDQHTQAEQIIQVAALAVPLQQAAIRAGQTYYCDLEVVETLPVGDECFKQGGVYVLAGGLGGIGYQLSTLLAARYQARLIILGRRALNPEIEKQLGLLERLGAQVLYQDADITIRDSLDSALCAARQQFGQFDGVIHSACSLADAYIERSDAATFAANLATKVNGSILLHELTTTDQPDFILFFSSILSFQPQAGTSNYVAGCLFQDQFAGYLTAQGQKSLSINWGYWNDVGLGHLPQVRQLVSTNHIPTIPTETGLKALQAMLATPNTQLLFGHKILSGTPDTNLKESSSLMTVAPSMMTSDIKYAELVYGLDAVNHYAFIRLLAALQARGLLMDAGQPCTLILLQSELRCIPKYQRLLQVILSILEQQGVLVACGEKQWQTTAKVKDEALLGLLRDIPAYRDQLLAQYPDKQAHLTLLDASLSVLGKIIAGEVPATDILFPQSSMQLVEGIYKDNQFSDYYNALVTTQLVAAIRQHQGSQPFRILEVGAGTGGTTAMVLPSLAPFADQISYCYTDISPAFVRYGKKKFAEQYSFLDFSALNIDQAISEQVLERLGQFDLIFATNVVHACKNLTVTLQQLKKLMRPGGHLLLNELCQVQDFLSLTFGMLDGWWLYDDESARLPHSPLLSPQKWQALLAENGFTGLGVQGHPEQDANQQKQIVVVAQCPAHHTAVPATIPAEPIAVTRQQSGPSVAEIRHQLTGEIAQVLDVAAGEISPDDLFSELGIDSILAAELVSILNRKFDTQTGIDLLTTTGIFDYPSINRLATYLSGQLSGPVIATGAEPGNTAGQYSAAGTPDFAVSAHSSTSNSTISGGHTGSYETTAPVGAKPARNEPIAIVGISGQFPGADDLAEFWENIACGATTVGEVPADRWDMTQYFSDDPAAPNKTYCGKAGFLSNADQFDPQFFNISPKEAELMDPQQRLFLQHAWHAIEDAACDQRRLSGEKAGIFVGVSRMDYEKRIQQAGYPLDAHVLMGSDASVLATRLAYLLDMRGGSLAVDTACSSSLVAIHLACQQIQSGELDMALAGGIFVMTGPDFHVLTAKSQMLSTDGLCKTFDDRANGMVPAEGVGVLVLKPLSRAQADHDHIYAVIKASGINQDGKTNGITAPSALSQAALERDVYQRAGVDPVTIGYAETHGTGTRLGDPIEVKALTDSFRDYTDKKQFCALGAVKANIGHAITAAGVAGVLKVLLAMQHRKIPPVAGFQAPNQHIDFTNSPFYVPTRLEDWPQQDTPRRAVVSSFGFSGTNAHLLLEESVAQPSLAGSAGTCCAPQLFVLSAKTPERLQIYAQQFLDFLQNQTVLAPPSVTDSAVLSQQLLRICSELLGLAVDDIFPEDTWQDQGMDRLILDQLCDQVNHIDGCHITLSELASYPTISALATALSGSGAMESGNGNSQSQLPDLRNLVYTMQVGRQAMPERLAILVESVADLSAKLEQFVSTPQSDEGQGIWCASVANKQALSLVLEGNAGAAFLNTLLAEQQFRQLGSLWVTGVDIDWTLLWQQQPVQKLSLPGYPFAKESYWITATGAAGTSTLPSLPQTATVSSLHPLLGCNRSTLRAQRFDTTLTGDEFYLADHLVAGKKVLPGVAYLEMLRAAGEAASEQTVTKITRVVWSQATTVEQDAVDIRTYLYPENEHLAQCEVVAVDSAGHEQLKVQAQVHFGTPPAVPSVAALDIPAIQARCDEALDQNAFYAPLSECGMGLGYSFQVVNQWQGNQQEMLSLVCLPEQRAQDADVGRFVLHPSLLDGALQTPTLTLFRHLKQLHIPFSMGAIEIFGPLAARCYVYAQRSKVTVGQARFDISIADEQGQLLVQIKEFMPRPFGESLQVPELTYWRPEWHHAELVEAQSLVHGGNVLLYTSSNQPTDQQLSLQQALQSHFSGTVILVSEASEYKTIDQFHYVLDATAATQCGQLMVDLRAASQLPELIVFLATGSVQTDLTEALNRPFQHLFNLVQQNLLIGSELKQFIYLSQDSEAGITPQTTGVQGFLKSLMLEQSGLSAKQVSYASKQLTGEQYAALLLSELQQLDYQPVRYDRNGQRSVQQWQPVAVTNLPADADSLLRTGGVYLITGGASGLGLIVAQALATDWQARLVLCGRSPLGDTQQQALQQLNQSGSEAIYLQADISSVEQATALIAAIREKWGALNGVIHSAGVIRDARLQEKTPEAAAQVLAAKVQGVVNLDQATQDETLDCFVMFSAVAGVTGNTGQTDYAYANRFMDGFAEWRETQRQSKQRSGKSLAINWPLWRDGGMQVNAQTEQWFERFLGMTPMSSESGVKAFYAALAQSGSQFLVVEGYPDKIAQRLNAVPKPLVIIPATDLSVESGIDQQQTLKKIQQALLAIAAQILKISQTIDPDADFIQYGFDSISFTDFANVLNKEHDTDITPAQFFEYPSVSTLGQFLWEAYADKFAVTRSPGTPVLPQVPASVHATIDNDFSVESGLLSPVPAITPRSASRSRFVPVGASAPEISYAGSVRTGDKPGNEPIAIIGMSGVLPQSDDLDEFWQHLIQGDDLITEIPSDRWDWREYDGDPSREANKTYARWGGFMRAVDQFDAGFFGISAREAELMDPQQRLFLQTVWHTIEDAGYKTSDLSGSETGVFVGVATTDYAELLKNGTVDIEAYTATGSVFSILSNRISYLLNLHGPSEPIDTACSSSLVAINRAVEAIRSGRCGMAIAGGVNAMITPTLTLAFSKAGMMSPEGRCKTFDEGADGYVRGEGVGAVLLKPLSLAEQDGDHIHGVILAGAENHGGHAASLTAPNPKAQSQLLERAYDGIDPASISYIEAHGTGTSLGDPIEVNGLKSAFTQLYKTQGKDIAHSAAGQCGIGSVKTNMGHLETAAGIAGLFKVLLAMRHQCLPGNLHFNALNPYIQLDKTPFFVVKENQAWLPQDDQGQALPRRAGISSFGFGGANAHVVVEEYINPASVSSDGPQLFVLSAKNQQRLHAYAERMLTALQDGAVKDTELADLIYTLQIGRDEMPERLAIVCEDLTDLRAGLVEYIEQDSQSARCYQGNSKADNKTADLLLQGDAGSAFLQIILQKRELATLAQLWVSGLKIDWRLLHSGTRRRLSLPVYPFAGERYWIPENSAGRVRSGGDIARLHPLLERNTSNLYRQQFTTCFTGDEFYLKDHVLAGQKVLPAVAYLEMVRAAGELAAEKRITALSRLVWLRPVVVGEDNVTVDVCLLPQAGHSRSDQLDFTVTSPDQELVPQTHIQGRLHIGDAMAEKSVRQPAVLDLEAIRSRCQPLMDSEQVYAALAERGFTVGKGFQPVKQLVGNKDEALAELQLPAHLQAGAAAFYLHPALLDGALQTAVMGLFMEADHLFAVFSIARIDIYDSLPERCFVHATRTNQGKNQHHQKLFNMQILDEAGRVLVRIHEFVVREFSLDASPENAQGQSAQQRLSQASASELADSITEPADISDASETPVKETWQQRFSQDLLQITADVIKAKPENLSFEEDLRYYGFESISFTELTNQINQQFQLDLTPAVFFEHGTLKGANAFLQNKFAAQLSKQYPVITTEQSAVVAKTSVVQTSHTKPEPAFGDRFLSRYCDEPIAIVGMAGKLPSSTDLQAFWEHLVNGDDLISEIPESRWDWRDYDGDPQQEANKTRVRWAGLMPDVDCFDPRFFGLSPREAELMDPQQRLFLECIWQTVEDAGYAIDELSGSRTGVFAGVATGDYRDLMQAAGIAEESYSATGTVNSIVANRVSFLFNFVGPCEVIDTACSSSLVAIHRAVQAIRSGDCNVAFAGGVNAILSPRLLLALSKAGMLSETGQCRTFSADADGYVRSEGVGAIMLKPLSQARADGDHVYAVIRGSAENHGGHATSLTAPNPASQANVISEAWLQTDIDPRSISYIEAHGTGTPLGDPIEVDGLKLAFEQLYQTWGCPAGTEPHCALGSVKSFAGHMEASAGIAGVLKVLLSMQHQVLPGNRHAGKLNPYIRLEQSPLYVLGEREVWQRPVVDGIELPRRAGVSSFGFGGVNAHLVLEEAVSDACIVDAEPAPGLFLLSARTPEQLKQKAQQLQHFLQTEDVSFASVAYTLQCGRRPMKERLAVIADSPDDLMKQLKNWLSFKGDVTVSGCFRGSCVSGEPDVFTFASDPQKDVTRLAEQWVSADLAVDWLALYPHPPQRVALPTYPFARERYWFTAGNKQSTFVPSADVRHETSLLNHPLLDENVSTLSEQCFRKTLKGSEFYLQDHQINQQLIFPGTAYLEMARAAFAYSYPGNRVSAIKNIIWHRPIIFIPRQLTALYTAMRVESHDVIGFDVSSGSAAREQRVLHATGTVNFAGTDTGRQAGDLGDLVEWPLDTLSANSETGVTFYQRLRDNGYNYGEQFRFIDSVSVVDNDTVIARLDDKKVRAYAGNRFVLHPGLLDAMLQVSSALPGRGMTDDFYFPYSIDSLTCHSDNMDKATFVCLKKVTPLTFDVYLLGSDRGILISIDKFKIKPAAGRTPDNDQAWQSDFDYLQSLGKGDGRLEELMS